VQDGLPPPKLDLRSGGYDDNLVQVARIRGQLILAAQRTVGGIPRRERHRGDQRERCPKRRCRNASAAAEERRSARHVSAGGTDEVSEGM
jgi:hypothetical protein